MRAVLVMSMLACAGCSTCKPKEQAPPASADAGAVDAGRVDDDAGAHAEVVADAGSEPDAGVRDAHQAGRPKLPAGSATIYDRILAKPKKPEVDVDALRAEVEKKTGLKVTQARKTARTWIMLQFAPAPGGRTASQQAELVAQLQKTGLFESVEGDRLMQIK
jgi:hypothetical protein